MLHFGIVRPDERGLITNPLGLAAVRLTISFYPAGLSQNKPATPGAGPPGKTG